MNARQERQQDSVKYMVMQRNETKTDAVVENDTVINSETIFFFSTIVQF